MKQITILFAFFISLMSIGQTGTDCSTSILVPSTGCSAVGAYTNAGIAGTILPSCFGAGANNTMWFRFIATSPTVTATVNGGTLTQTMVSLLSPATAPCTGPFTELGCSNPGTLASTVTYSSLTIGNTYYIAVDGANSLTGTFQLCLNSPNQPSNDSPCSPINLPANNFCSAVGAYSLVGATGEALTNTSVPSCFAAGNTMNSVYFTYTAIGVNNTITVTGGATSLNRPQVALLLPTAGCGGTTFNGAGCATAASGVNTVTLTANNLIPGTVYYVLVDGVAANTGSFQICINSYVPTSGVVNDQCSGATPLCPNKNYVSTTVGATSTNDISVAEWDCNGVVDNAVWFSFVTTNPVQPIDFNINTVCTGDYLQFEVFRKTGGGSLCTTTGWTSQGCTSLGPTATTNLNIAAAGLVANTTYYIVADNWPGENCNFNFTITGNAGVNAGADQQVCLTAAPFTLTGFTPTGGVWSGPGITNTATGAFSPAVAGIGVHTLYYTQGSCTDSKIVTVTAPQVTVSNDVTICIGSSTTLSGNVSSAVTTVPLNFTNSTAVTIPDNNINDNGAGWDGTGGATSTIATTGLLAGFSFASVTLTITHAYDADLVIYLTNPCGTKIRLIRANGGSGDNFTNTVFSSTATAGIATGTAPFTGSFIPQGGAAAWTTFMGCTTGNGNWVLNMGDDLGGTTGSLQNWALSFNNPVPAPTYAWTPTTNMTNSTTLSPTVTPTATTAYTLTATDVYGCVNTDIVTVTVTPLTLPTFTALGPYCQCATPGLLPTTSLNGFTGTWSPATISTATAGTTVYTFTPTVGQCASVTTMSVTINAVTATAPVAGASTVACPALAVAPTAPTVLDNCGRTLTVSAPVVSAAPACSGTQTYTYTYSDCAGGTYPWVYTYTISAPTVTMPAAGASIVACPALVVAPTAPTVLDNCGRTLTVSAPVVSAAPACSGTQTYTYTYTSCSGTTYPWVYTYTISAPTVTMPAAGGSAIACPALAVVPTAPTVLDNCGRTLTVSAPVISAAPACNGIQTYTYTYTSCSGTTYPWVYTYTINDLIPPTASNPASVSVSGMGAIPVANPLVVIDEADNCSVPTVAFVSDVSDGLLCPTTITRTYSVTDLCLNQILVTQLIVVGDAVIPTASNPAPVSTDCMANVPATNPLVVTDEADNGATPIVTWEDDVLSGTCPITITRRYRVTDDCGNFIFVTQLITVNDVTAPVFAAAPAAVTVSCSANVPAMTNLGYTDNCIVAGSVAGTDVSNGGSCPEIITRTWTITDACGNVATSTQTITVHDLIAPVFAVAPVAVTVSCSANVPAMTNLSYTDNCDAAGSVVGTDVSNGGTCPEIITRTWTITDACGNAATSTQTITVHDLIAPVFAAAPAAVTVSCSADVPAMTNLGYTDNCDAAGTVVGTDGALIGGTCGGTITRTWTFTDACGNIGTATQTITVDDNILPTASNPATITVPGGPAPATNPAVVIDEADNCSTPVVAFVSETNDGAACPLTITRIYSVTDACGNTINVTHLILITDPFLPTASNPTPINVECIGDVPAPDPLVVTDEADNQGVPTVAFVSDVSNGATCPEVITRTYSVTDACLGQILVTQTITVLDITAPTATAPATVNVECIGDVPASDVNLITDEADNCTTPVVAFVGDISDGATCPETITRSYSITDACGNVTNVTQFIIVNDITAPTGTAPATVNVECIGDVPAADVNLIADEADNCSTPVVAFAGDLSDGATCPETITRTYSITDACGNVTNVTQSIIVNDITAPTATNPATITVPGGPAPATDPTVVTDEVDNCTTPVVAFVSETTDGAACPETITRIYSVTDACGNTINVTHMILITDPFLPTASNPTPINVECVGDVPAPDPLVVTDEADNQGPPTVAFVSDASDGNTCPEVITRTYSVTDDCLGQILVTQTITVLDVTAPTATAPATVNVECIGDVPASDVNLITDEADNCTTPVVAFVGDVSDGATCPETITRTYSITDACGNTTNVTQLIIVDDITVPTGTAPATVNVECIGDVPAADVNLIADEADNCSTPVVAFAGDLSDGATCPETITRTYSITDACGNVTNVTQSIIVNDLTAPTASNPATTTVPGGPAPATDPTVVTDEADNCSTPVVAFVSESTDGAACPETITRIYSVTDACGNSINVTHLILITDPFLPTASNPAGINVECIGDVPAPDPLVVTDEADNQGPPTVAFVSDASDGNTCPEVITRTYSVTDDCLGQILVTQTITVLDITAPTATAPATVNVECIGDVPASDVNLITDEADNCTTPVVAFVGDVSDGATCPETITRTYSITDACGNTTNVTQLIIVDDITAPTGTAPATVNVECIGDVPAADVNLIADEADNCSTPVVAFAGDLSDGATCPETITRTYSITDACGNVTNVTQSIIVNDLTAPTASNPATTTVPGGPAPATDPTVVTDEADNCSTPVVAFVSESTDGAACPETITRIYSVTDACGNSINVTHLILITDPFLPTASNPAGINVECIGDVPAPDPLVVTDEADNQGVPTVAFVSDVSNGATCPEIITRTYSVTDVCLGQILVTQTITVLDITAPTASNPAQITVQCIGDVPAPNIAVVTDEADNCTVPVVVFVSDVSDNNTCNGEIITRTYSVTDACGNTINVTQSILIDAYTPNFTLSSTNPTTCGGNEGTITISGLNPLESYIITYGGINVPNTFNGAGNIVITGLTAGNYTSFIVKDANCLSCLMTDNSIITLVDPAPPVVDAGANQAVCEGSAVVLSGAGAVIYSWNNLVSDGGAFTPAVGTVVYTVTGTDSNGCTDTDQVTVTVNPLPIAPSGSQVTYCIDAIATPLFAETLAVTGFEVLSLNWYGTNATGGIASSFAPTPSTAVVGLTNYYVSQTNTVTGCEGPRYVIPVTVVAKTITTFTQIPAVCQGLVAAPLLPSSTNSPAIPGTWNPATINTQIPGPAQYTFTPASNQCATTSVMNVVVNPTPTVVASVAPVCYPELIDLTAPSVTTGSTAGTTFSYFSNLNPLTVLSTPTAVTSSGTYYVQATTAQGCSNIAPVYVLVHPLPVASFNGSPALVSSYDPQTTMVNTSVDAVSYEWGFNDGTTSTETSPTHVFAPDEYGEFEIKLTAISQFGCVDVTFGSVTVKEELVYYVPNSFTPNGDEDNDIFFPIFTSGYDPNEFSLLIFNRWGQIVFESYDPKAGWKGTFGENGEFVQDGTYTWKIEFKSKSSPKREVVVGHVNVFR
jgi:gliding motility-associated-like protein